MIRLRHRKWFQRTVLVAMATLLWSQFALAGHGGCLDMLGPSTAVAAAAESPRHSHSHGCDAELPSADKPLCAAHCTEGDVSTDSGRIPPVPPLFAGAWLPWFAVVNIADGVPVATSIWVDSPPRPAWNRPTAHPAALLLI